MFCLAVRDRTYGGIVMGFFTDVMTVYNYHRDAAGEHWLRSVVYGVQWRHGKRRMTAKEGVFTDEPEESITVDFRRVYGGNKPYTEPFQYQRMTLKEAAGVWTLDQANGMDVVICGEVNQEISPEYGISNLKKDYPHVYSVVSVADNRNRPRLNHIRVVAK